MAMFIEKIKNLLLLNFDFLYYFKNIFLYSSLFFVLYYLLFLFLFFDDICLFFYYIFFEYIFDLFFFKIFYFNFNLFFISDFDFSANTDGEDLISGVNDGLEIILQEKFYFFDLIIANPYEFLFFFIILNLKKNKLIKSKLKSTLSIFKNK